ncbi:MAG: DNA topoisomerase I, partial [Candidatus Hydrothermarchaeales archaeon]
MKLIITEKPKVTQKIAYSIAEKPTRKREFGVTYYEVNSNGDKVLIAPAAGHLYSLKQDAQKGWDYPVFDVSWAPLNEIEKSKEFVGRYIKLLSKISSEVDEFYLATDYDIEGELLGYNALRFACNPGTKTVWRMKFSALTKSDLSRAYRNPVEIDKKLIAAGEARHIMDWYWGINTSRALRIALRKAMGRATVSAGRVQTPALAILVERERTISKFVAETYWEVLANLDVKGIKVKAHQVDGRIFDEARAKKILENSSTKSAVVSKVEVEKITRPPPYPFDLGTLQRESWRVFRYSPKQTQKIAQSLYESGYISYPRTSSQKLPPAIGYKRILESLARAKEFKGYAETVLKKSPLRPRQGMKTDPAHPAIYPTGVIPKRLGTSEERIYALVVHRFIATFGDPLLREEAKVRCLLNKEEFEFKGSWTLDEGWLPLYPYIKIKELRLPALHEGEKLGIEKIDLKEDETRPPDRFNQSTLVRELENRGLGTKATRADIVDTLFRREYVQGSPLEVTELGLSVINALEENVPVIISEELTRSFEEKLEKIQSGEMSQEQVLDEAKEKLTQILREFKAKEEAIGAKLMEGLQETERKKRHIGTCPSCGHELRVVRSRASGKSFIGCSNYPKCSNSYPLPQRRGVRPTDKKCNACGLPMISVP